MTKATIGFAMCGSFCTFSKAFTQMQRLVDSGYDVIPIMSQNAFSTSTRFGKAEETVKRAEEITGKAVLHSVVQTEPIGPKKMCDLLVIAPCTGNTACKAVARNYRHGSNNGGKVASENFKTCAVVRCNK